ncbi:MAG: MBL fold metallo-hydrolase [Thaumarchaeota archaeon]|nr:MBL fold metallo-hydrolase [Nitrososphaerota archaeon]
MDTELKLRMQEGGIHPISIETPFSMGNVNCYLIEGNPLTLIDAAVRTDSASDKVTRTMKTLGYEIEDIEKIYLTHAHPDHLGLVSWIMSKTEADVYVSPYELDLATDFEGEMKRYRESARNLMFRCGVSEELYNEMMVTRKKFGPPFEPINAQTVKDGDLVKAGDLILKALHCPGHSKGSTCFLAQDAGVVFVGDHVLPRITPNISHWIEPLQDSKLQALHHYLSSLRSLLSFSNYVALAGHGDVIPNLGKRIKYILNFHEERLGKVLRVVSKGVCTPHEVSLAIFGKVDGWSLQFAVFEALSHLDYLEDEGKIRRVDSDSNDAIRFHLLK